MAAHPYRDCSPRVPEEPPPAPVIASDDVAVALLLFLVGVLGVSSGLAMDGQAQLSLGLVLIAFAVKVALGARERVQ